MEVVGRARLRATPISMRAHSATAAATSLRALAVKGEAPRLKPRSARESTEITIQRIFRHENWKRILSAQSSELNF